MYHWVCAVVVCLEEGNWQVVDAFEHAQPLTQPHTNHPRGARIRCNLVFNAFVLKKGNYTSLILTDYQKDIDAIGLAFSKLLQNKHIDPQGYCVEWYLNDTDMRCMVRLIK